ncbi:putative monooxygenase [Hyaloraphidium curvatum]|nr:putative monooxygenase [Hyaloraphidium curvatum]
MASEDPQKVFQSFAPLKKKYLQERDKRLRKEGNQQFIPVFGDPKWKHFIEDVYTPRTERAAVEADVEVLLLGGGFSTLIHGAKLRKMGVKNIRIVEEAGGLGGTWYWNRYPMAACDTESYIYLPLLEEMQFMPGKSGFAILPTMTEKYTKAYEILKYCDMIAKKFDLYDGALFSTHVDKLVWDDDKAVWNVYTDRGDHLRAKFVVSSIGLFPRAKLPGVEGIEKFKGHMFHTSRWDYGYTGGDPRGNLDKLNDKVVAFIGTGATAIQAIPPVAESAKHLYVFQRTPSCVDVRGQRDTDPTWWKEYTKTPGWQRRRMESFNTLTQGGMDEDLVGDAWTSTLQFIIALKKKYAGSGMKNGDLLQLADFQKMEQIRGRVDEIVKDKATAEKLKPYYNQYCKRPCFSDVFLQTFNRPNVTLVDTDGKGVREISERGIVVDGKEYAVDLIIFGTGFEVGVGYLHNAGYNVFGRNGLSLAEKWKEGLSTLHGAMVSGFPNYFMIQSAQSAFLYNNHHFIDELSDHVTYIIGQARERKLRAVEPSKAAEAEWVDTIIKNAALRKTFYEECTPGYYNLEGQVNARVARNLQYGAGSVAFFGLLSAWRKKGNMPGMDVEPEKEGARASL